MAVTFFIQVMLCINEKGEKFLLKKIDGEAETPWDVMEVMLPFFNVLKKRY